jgi:hypothetical protein
VEEIIHSGRIQELGGYAKCTEKHSEYVEE